MTAVVEAAHARGHKVAIHGYGASSVKDAVLAGAASVEHGIELDDETLTAMVRQGTVWVPTIDHNRYYIDSRAEYGWDEAAVASLAPYIAKGVESLRRAVRLGVKVGLGSDAVFSGFGQNTRELGWFVKAGMTPAQALTSATVIPAQLLGIEDHLGRIAPGYLADFVALDGDPLENIEAVYRVRWVMKDGVVVVDRRAPSSPVALPRSDP